ncbi:MAG: PD-(D/E)XK nuclease family protein [Rickettsiales bacterium]|nr:PD-(D/E)XK nuclease family protein [Rickettsiales bacterium]
MGLNKNIFCASNPARLLDALLSFNLCDNDIVFLPSRRAIRSLEKALADRVAGSVVLLPKLVALGEEPEDESEERRAESEDVVSDDERIIVLAKLLAAAENKSIASVLPTARDLVRMQNYIENEQSAAQSARLDWNALVDEKYAAHFQKKAEFLNLASAVLPAIFPGKITESEKRNSDIRKWINVLMDKWTNGQMDNRIIICGSTGSVPATADLMEFVAGKQNGIIILPGKIMQGAERGAQSADICNPYYSELKFLERINVAPSAVGIIDVGESNIDFLNSAFDNDLIANCSLLNANSLVRIDCARESEEADVVAEIAADAVAKNKIVLVITPDAAGNQRLTESLFARGLVADFSGGTSGAASLLGRAILNELDAEIEKGQKDKRTKGQISDLFSLISDFNLDFSESDLPIIEKIKEVSDICERNGIVLNIADARAIIADAIGGVQIRPPQNDDAKIRVLGTIESRMQTADIVILTGLNEGMFPATGYENAWLPRRISDVVGLPPPERKVSLMALDFINLSCADTVYWTRSSTAGGAQTTESRFLSRVVVRTKDKGRRTKAGHSFLCSSSFVHCPLDYSPPRPKPADYSPVYATTLEHLFHNPYSFYAKQILKLRVKDDWWAEPDARDFGNIVHLVIERRAQSGERNGIVEELDAEAKKILPPGSILFHFWHKRFVDIAPFILEMLDDSAGGAAEIKLQGQIAGRVVLARADMVCGNTVYDIKTGAAPTATQLGLPKVYRDGRTEIKPTMPQLPLEAFMLNSANANMKFLQLQRGRMEWKIYDGADARQMIENTVQKTAELFGQYGKDGAAYEYLETGDAKYKSYDDLARVGD